jgi:rare lipoprotein A
MKRLLLALSLAAVAAGAQAQTADDRFATRRAPAHATPRGSNPSPVSALLKWLAKKTATTPTAKPATDRTAHPARIAVETPAIEPPTATPQPRSSIITARTEEPRVADEPHRNRRLGHGYHSCAVGEGERIISAFYSEGSHTASGARFNPDAMTAAHRTLPFGTRLTVINPRNRKSVTVTVNDRGPFVKGVTLDLSRGAAKAIGLQGTGAVCMAKA